MITITSIFLVPQTVESKNKKLKLNDKTVKG